MTPSSNAPAGLEKLRQQWSGASERERRMVGLALGAVLVLIVCLGVLKPAWHTSQTMPAQLAAVEAELVQMRSMAAEAKALKDQTGVPPAEAHAALKAAVERLGGHAKLNLLTDRASVSLQEASPQAVQQLLTEVRAGARLRPLSAQLQRGGQGINGQIAFSLPPSP